MQKVEPEGLSELARLSLGAACDCMCSENQYAGAQGAGYNGNSCGCFCAGSSANNNANKNGSSNKLSGLFAALDRIEAGMKRESVP
jgi:hypothetical protein